MPSHVNPADPNSVPDPCEPSDVATLFGVDPKTVTRWAVDGKIPYFRTLGGHRRYHRDEVLALWRQTHGQQLPR